MTATTRSKIQLFGAWCGILYVALIFFGWVFIARFLPPHRPSATALQIASIFQADYTRIRIGMVCIMFAALALIPFAAVISQLLARVEGGAGVLAFSALLGGAGTMVLTFYPAIWWLVAAFRIDRAPDLIFLFNDLSWLQLIGGVSLFYALPLSIAVAAFCDTSSQPVFPRWAGYYNLWTIVMIMPDQLLFFFQKGPFAWNGLFGFWIPLVAFISWFFVNFHVVRQAIIREMRSSA